MKILACPGCGNRFFKYRHPDASCFLCSTLVRNAILMSEEERAAVRESFQKVLGTREQSKQANNISQEGHEQDLRDLFG